MVQIILNLLGVAVVVACCFLLSWNKKQINWKLVIKALVFQFIIAFFIVKVPIGQKVITTLSDGLTSIVNCGNEGLAFVFGDLANRDKMWVFIVQGLGNIIFVSALVGLLYYLGVIGFIVKWIGIAVGKLLGTTEVESFVSVANLFLGHTDSPILVRRYIRYLTDSELFVILVSGMGSMSASILGGYHALGIPMEYLLIASAMVPIGSMMIAKIILPQVDEVKSITDVKMDSKGEHNNMIDALTEGATTGMKMVISIAASIVGFVGVVALVNMILSPTGVTLSNIFSYIFAPFGFFMGLDGKDILLEGALLGNKLILNEFVAFKDLAGELSTLDPRVGMICAISLCGFANLSSMGMCVGGIGVLCPEKRHVISRLIVRATLGGMFVSILSALLVSIVMLI